MLQDALDAQSVPGPQRSRGLDLGRPARRRAALRRQPRLDALENRQLMSADFILPPVISLTPDEGTVLVVRGTDNAPREYSASSPETDSIRALAAEGPVFRFDVRHEADPDEPDDVSFEGRIAFQTWENLTPLVVDRLETLINIELTDQDGFYTNNNIHRVADGFPDADGFIVQGGSLNLDGTGDLNTDAFRDRLVDPNALAPDAFPFQDEFVDFVRFNEPGRIAMANAGPDTNDSQFFVTTSTPTALNDVHTIFGQIIGGSDLIELMTQVTVGPPDDETPTSPIEILGADSVEATASGVLLFDTTEAQPGDSTTVTVTAVDQETGEMVTQTALAAVPTDTGSVRFETNVLLITPPPQRGRGATNTIEVIDSDGQILVLVNGELDTVQPAIEETFRIVVYGSKASDTVTVSPTLPNPVTLNGGQSGQNVLQAGGGPALIQAFFGRNIVRGSAFDDRIITQPRHALIQPSGGSDVVFLARPDLTGLPPGGQFFRIMGGRGFEFFPEGPRRPGRFVSQRPID